MPRPGQPSCHLQVRPPQCVLGGPGSHVGFSSHQPCGWAGLRRPLSNLCCRWKMNGTEMKLEPGSHHQLVGGNLVIMNPTKAQDAGVYQCLASNPVGTVVSREAVLRFGCETCRVPGHSGGGAEGAGKGVQKRQLTASLGG